jgi:signal transduction histidine kinase
MINKFITFSIIVILSLSVPPALGQSDPYNGYSLQHLTDEDGLPQNSINNLLVDDNGFLWLAAQVGMIRFNGSSFKLFSTGDKPLLESNVDFLGKNHTGDIYFKTAEDNLYCYPDGNCHALKLVNSPAMKGPILLNHQNQIFDFTHFLKDSRSGVSPAVSKVIFNDLFTHNDHFYVIDSTHIYLTYNDSLYYYDNKSLLKISGVPGSMPNYMTLNGRFYILKDDSVLKVYNSGRLVQESMTIGGDLEKDVRQLKLRGGLFHLFPGDAIHYMVNNRLYRITTDRNGILNTRFLLDLSFCTHISGVEYKRESDLLLIATGTEGVYLLRKSGFRSTGMQGPLKDYLSQYLFGPIALHQDREILTNKFVFNENGAFNILKNPIPAHQKCLFIDHRDNVWSSVFNLPRRLTSDMKVTKVYPTVDGQIADYKEDAAGNLYCLTEKSLYRLETDSFRLLFTGNQLGFTGTNETFCEVAPELFWIGNVNGLIEYDPARNQFRSIPELAKAHIRCISRCRDGSILLGTYGEGYFYYRHGHFFKMPLDKNGFLVTAHCFLEDKDDNVWIPCNKGLFKVPKADMDCWCDSNSNNLIYYYYGRQDGLNTNEFNGGYNTSGIITSDGFAAILSMKGMVCFYPDSLRTDFPKGPVDITNIEIDGRAGIKTKTIELPSDYNSLLLEVSCPYLGNRNNLYLEYSLKGLNEEWRQVPENGIISFSRLGPGNYTLRVRKVNGFGKNNYLYKECRIVVIPHFYQTTWFILLALFGLLLLLILLVQLWLKLIEKRKEIRIKAEKLKGTVVALEETVEKLQESKKALLQTSKVREKLISLVIHDLRSPLRFLTMLASDLHDNQEKFSNEELRERTYWIKKGTHDIYNFSEDFLLWVTSQKNNFTITKRHFPISPLLQEIYDFFKEQVQQKGNSIFYDSREDLNIYSDPHILITIIRNLVDNANKYTDRGRIDIKAYTEGEYIIIAVSDTGKGMSPRQMEAFLQNDNMDDLKSGSQLGHKFVFDLTKRINGSVSIESKEQEGTTVKLRFEITPPSVSYTSPE